MIKILTNCSYAESKNGHIGQWSYPIKGVLEINNELICFEKWKIPLHEINEAVFNTEEIKNIKQQILLLNCDGIDFMFTFFEIINAEYQFPFQVIKSNNRSSINEMLEGNQNFLQKMYKQLFIAFIIIYIIQYLIEI